MSSTIEYVRFETADPEGLAAQREHLVEHLRATFGADFLGAHLARCEDGSMVDVIVWASPEAAQRAAREVPGDPDLAGFFSLIGEVHEMRHAEVLHSARPA